MRNRLGTTKSLDLMTFWLMQYFIPAVALPDLLLAVTYRHLPVFGPLASVTVVASFIALFMALQRVSALNNINELKRSPFVRAYQALQGTLYMLHWLPVIASVTARISVRPKRLKWVKTSHAGEPLGEFSAEQGTS
ncbi:MAG: hypothetical protein AAGF24_15050 [Cyanobacteria bacterium P01_H01_bin.121]